MFYVSFFESQKLGQKKINAIKNEISQNTPLPFTVHQAIFSMLNQPEKIELACIIYSLQKLYWQAALANGFSPFQQQFINGIFEDLPGYFDRLNQVKEGIFACQALVDSSLSQEVGKKLHETIFNDVCRNIIQSTEAETSRQKSRWLWVIALPVWALCAALAIHVHSIRDQTREEILPVLTFGGLCALVVLLPIISTIVADYYLYPSVTGPICEFNSLLKEAALRYTMQGGRARDGKILTSSGEYVTLFASYPQEVPQTLYELAHKLIATHFIASGEKIPLKIVEEELITFLNRCNDLTSIEEGRPSFPIQDFLNLMAYTSSFASFVDWPVDSQVKREDKIKQIIFSSSFYSSEQEVATSAALLSKKCV